MDTNILLNSVVIVVLLILSFWSGGLAYRRRPNKEQSLRKWFWEWFGGLSHEFAGAVFISLIVLILVTMPLAQNAENDQFQELLRQARSTDHGIAEQAVRTMFDSNWFANGRLIGAYLRGADLSGIDVMMIGNLEGINLSEANLEGLSFSSVTLRYSNLAAANMTEVFFLVADFEGANLWGVNLTDARIMNANLRNVNLSDATLVNANLSGSDFYGAQLVSTDLRGTNLENSNLTGVTGIQEMDETTILPDGANWSSSVDMRRFTEVDHPDYWSPNR